MLTTRQAEGLLGADRSYRRVTWVARCCFDRQKSWYDGGDFKYFIFSPLLGEMIRFDWYFSDGLKPPTRKLPSKNRRLKLRKNVAVHPKEGSNPYVCMYVRNEALVEKAWFENRPAVPCRFFFFTPIGRFSCSCQLFFFFVQAAGRSLCQPQWMKWEVLDVQSLFTCPSKPWLWKNGDPYTFTQSGVRSHKKLSNTPHPSQQKKNQL